MVKLTTAKLKKSVEHFEYEVIMLRHATKRLISSNEDQMVVNTYLEIFALHARNLFYFFYTNKKKRRKDDLLAEDYMNQLRGFINSRTPKKELSIILVKTAKQIAHLTYSRTNYNKRNKGWNYCDIYKKMEKTINAFYENLPVGIKGWFKNVDQHS